ncbi:hypothetical protein ACI65C_009265 [Semiaphis heraclei]
MLNQSTVVDESNENNTKCVDNSINITLPTNNIDEEKEEIRNIELKQSISENSNSKFSSPCFPKFIPNEKLIATEVINRYIRMDSISSNDSSLSEDQNKSTFGDETVSFTDAQETESIHENYAFDETSTCEHLSVSSVLEQSVSCNQQNVLDDSNNVCTLIHCSQEDDTDLSICSDSELGDVTEDSIVADEYSVTPGKQRLFDLRVTKQSLRPKALVASAPFMDRIEETATPVLPKVLDSPLILNEISHKHSEIKEGLKVSSVPEICHGTSTDHFYQTSHENLFETSKIVNETVGEFSTSNDLKNIASINTSVDTMFDETMNTNKLSTDSMSMNINKSLNKTDQIQNTLNDTTQLFDTEQSINIMTDIMIPTDINDHHDKEYLISAQLDAKSANTSVEDKAIDETMYTNKLCSNNKSLDSNQSLNETDHIQTAINDTVTVQNLNEKSIPTADISIKNNKEFSVAMEVDIKSTNTSYVDKEFDETMCSNYSTNKIISIDLNQSLNKTEHNFDDEKSMCVNSKIAIPTSDICYNDEEFSVAMEVDIKSTNTSYVDKEFDESMCSNKKSTNNRIMNLNETNIVYTLNETEQKFNDEELSVAMEVDIKSTSCVDKEINETVCSNNLSISNQSTDLNKSLKGAEQNDDKKPTYITSSIAIPALCLTDHNDEKENSITKKVDIKSIDSTVVDKIFDEQVNTKKLSINNESMDFNKSLDEINVENTLNDTVQIFGEENSMNNISSMALPTSNVNDCNDEGFSVAMEVDIKSTNTSFVDKELDDTVHAKNLLVNKQSMDLNKSIDEINIINSLNDTEQKFDDEKSTYIMSNIDIPTLDVNDHNDKEYSIATKIDIKSINTSIVDKIFDESMLINANKLLADSQAINCNKSLNENGSTSNNTEHGFMNTSVSTIHIDDNLVLSKQDQSNLINTINSDNSFVGVNEVNITCNTSLEDPSCMMRQYLDFEQAVNELCNDISSASCPDGQSNKPKESYDDEALEHLIEQTLSSDSFNLTKVNDNLSNYDGSNLSVIIENESLDTSSNDIEQHEDTVYPNNDVPVTLESESIVHEVNNIELSNKSRVVSTVATSSISELGLAYETDVNIQMKANNNMNETKHNGSSMFSDESSKMEFDTFNETHKNMNISTKQIFISEDVNEIQSTKNTLDEENLNPITNQINITNIPNSTALKLIPETEITQKDLTDQNELYNDNQQQRLLDTIKNIDNSLEEFTNQEQMLNFGDDKKEKQVENKTPKTQKILDFSIVQQTPTFDNLVKKQKVLNFSIVDPTPILKTTQQIYPNENVINNASLINFSAVDQMWNLEVMTKDDINFKDFQNSANDSSSNNLSSISSPDFELLVDESIETSNISNSSFDQTITDSNLNLSPYSCASNKTQNSKTEIINSEPLILINKHIDADEPSNSLNQTIELNKSKQKTVYDEHCVAEVSTTVQKSDLNLLSNTASNIKIDFSESKDDSNQQLHFNSNERAIVDFSIIDQGILENLELKNNTDIASDRNVTNLIEMTFVSKSDEQPIVSSENSIIPITSDNRSEKSIHSGSDEMNNTALHLEESTFLHNNTELLTDVQMNDESLLMESPEKSSIVDSFHSIELDNVQEDNKRKIETTQEYDNNEKKMKVETEMLKTPISMLYKIKNMFRSSEKQPSCVNNTKENNFKSGRCYQKLNFNKFEENNDDSTKSIKKSEILVKSKIPCKVTDKQLIKNDEFNSSSLSSLNDSIKQKKTIPKFSGVPVLSDVSNSSNRKCSESRIPSKFQK